MLFHVTPVHARGTACLVPSEYPSLQAAVNDGTCSAVLIEQAAVIGGAVIDRTISINGRAESGSRILGPLEISGAGTEAVLSQLHVDVSVPDLAGCFDRAIYVSSGASAKMFAVKASNAPGSGSCVISDQIFFDRFQP
jgi:hypothetical protein